MSTNESRRQDVFCYDCNKYFRKVEVSQCPKCGSEDADVYPEADYYNRDTEKKLLHKEAWLTSEDCPDCNAKMIYRDDGYSKLFVCQKKKCGHTIPFKKMAKRLNNIKTKKLYIV